MFCARPWLDYMKEQEIDEIIACLDKGRTLFYYFRDRYALLLMKYHVGRGKPIREIRRSRYSRLLSKPMFKELIRKAGDGVVTEELLNGVWVPRPECYLLTLGKWGARGREWGSWHCGYYQTSRQGANLVLQLNFSAKHNRPYYELIRPGDYHPFECFLHPITRPGYHTLAWSRIDIDMGCGEALIEEIQNDWIRLATSKRATVETLERNGGDRVRLLQREFRGSKCDSKAVLKYVEDVLKPHIKIWDEAILAATIWFLKEELGISRIFYHTFETGNRLKGIGQYRPPRSVYSDLPKKFVFQQTPQGPELLRRSRSSRIRSILEQSPSFYLLELNGTKPASDV